MARSLQCDICKRPCNTILAKIQYIPMDRPKRTTHSDYSHHADVGECCSERILEMFNFTPRRTRAEYQNSRKRVKAA